jgi:glyoxylase-like metal-dependent hydrolase (beta-lactamase superfamily II)
MQMIAPNITYFGSEERWELPTLVANTYTFMSDGRFFVLDPGMGEKRASELRSWLPATGSYDIVNTHAHEDHFLNSAAIAKDGSSIYLGHLSKVCLDMNILYVIKNVRIMFKTMDVQSLMMRYMKMGALSAGVLSLIIKTMPNIISSIMVRSQYKYSRYYRELKKQSTPLTFLPVEYQKQYDFGKTSFRGWEITGTLLALETPGHTQDSLTYYVRDQKALFIGDLDFFLNPSNVITGSINSLHNSLDKIIRLVESEKAEYLGSGHYHPIVGADAILEYLKAYQRKQVEIFDTVGAIIIKKTEWRWRDLLKALFQSASHAVRQAVAVDYPRSASYIDIYLYLLLEEIGYHYTQGTWLRQSEK